MFIPKKYRLHIIAAALLIMALAIISYGASRVTKTGFLCRVTVEAVAPIADAINSSLGKVKDFWSRYLFLVGLEEDNRRLLSEKVKLSEQLNTYREGYYESIRLRKLLDLKNGIECRTVAARVVANNNGSLFKTILIDKGSTDGLKPGYPVVSPEGIIGKIMETSWHSSQVLLMVDSSCSIDAIIQRTRTQCILQGTGEYKYKLKYVPQTTEVLPGDLLISSGMARIFPKGFIIGTISHVHPQKNELFQKIEAVPAVDFKRLEEVLVLISGEDESK